MMATRDIILSEQNPYASARQQRRNIRQMRRNAYMYGDWTEEENVVRDLLLCLRGGDQAEEQKEVLEAQINQGLMYGRNVRRFQKQKEDKDKLTKRFYGQTFS